MHGYVTSVSLDWYEIARSVSSGELNLWRPGIQHHFRALEPGEPVFLRLKAPHDRIVGFGLFSYFSIIPVSFAWRVFDRANGAESFLSLRKQLLQQREQLHLEGTDSKDPSLGAILLRSTVLLDEPDWLAPPSDLDDHAGHGKLYDLGDGEGHRIWTSCSEFLSDREGRSSSVSLRLPAATRFGPRSFHVAILDAWGRRCAATGEGVAAALRAARLSPAIEGANSLTNGVLLRADLACLFEAGYLSITPDHVLVVSRAMPAAETGRYYERYHGTGIRLPSDPAAHPDRELLWWHQREVFLG